MKSVPLPLGELEDGTHTLEVTAVSESGDTTKEKFMFGIDTTAPKILLNDPVTGQTFDHETGKIKFSGVTDPSVKVNVRDSVSGKSFDLMAGNDGRFEGELTFPTEEAMLKLSLSAEDAVGNASETSIELCSDALGHIEGVKLKAVNAEGKTAELADGASSLEAGEYSLELCGVLKGGGEIGLNSSSLTEWQVISAEGNAELKADGAEVKLTVHEGDIGMLSAAYKIHDQGAYNVVSMFGKKSTTEWTDNPGESGGKPGEGEIGALKNTKLAVTAKGPGGEDLSLDVTYTGSVSYNALKHVVEGMKTNKKTKADLHFELKGTIMDYADASFKVKNNLNVPVKVKNGAEIPLPDKKRPVVYLSLKPKKGIDGNWKKAVKAANKELKKQAIGFEIRPYDLSKLSARPTLKLNGPGTKVSKAEIALDQLTVKLKKTDFSYTIDNGSVVLKGLGNYTGTYTCTP